MSYVSTGHERLPLIRRTGELAYSGLPVKVVITTKQTYPGLDGMREHTSTHSIEIVSFSEIPLDLALFELPEDFRERSAFPSLWDDVKSRFQRARIVHEQQFWLEPAAIWCAGQFPGLTVYGTT